MRAFIFATLAVVAALSATPAAASSEASCASKVKENTKEAHASEKCVAQIGLQPQDIPRSEQEFIHDYNDKCYSKCLLSEMGLLKNLHFDRDAIKADITEHVVDEHLAGVITTHKIACLDEAEHAAGKVTQDNICNVAAHYLHCYSKAEEKLVC